MGIITMIKDGEKGIFSTFTETRPNIKIKFSFDTEFEDC